MRKFAFLLLLILPSAVFAYSQETRGYVEQACGLDMDRDGTFGEVADCTVCDGNVSTGDFTVDPDGDTTEEDINFIDSSVGVDDVNCGAPDDSCATIAYVLAGSNSSYAKYANGPGDGAEDILCIAGTFNEAVDIGGLDGVGGDTGYYTYTAEENHSWDFRLPDNPLMIVGWDQDGDGSYPPFDTDDTAIIEGGTPTDYKVAITVDDGASDSYAMNIELAHFTIQNFCTHTESGDWADETCGMFKGNNVLTPDADGNDYSYHHFYHDIAGLNNNKGHPCGSGTQWLFNLWSREIQWYWLKNISCIDCAGYGVRGSITGDYFRMENITVRAHGCGKTGSVNECEAIGQSNRLKNIKS